MAVNLCLLGAPWGLGSRHLATSASTLLFQSGTCKLRVWVLLQKYVTTQVWKTQTDREHSTVEKW